MSDDKPPTESGSKVRIDENPHIFHPDGKELQGHNDEAMRIRLAMLEEEHRDLDVAIAALETRPDPQILVIARLKKKKLVIKDRITKLRDLIEPDIIA